MRFKPPPSADSKIGWRVEFRTIDIQMTDFENSAFVVAVLMIVNVINYYNLDFITPISLVDINMDRSEKRDAVNTQKFWFKTSCIPNGELKPNTLEDNKFRISGDKPETETFAELTLAEILGGKASIGFVGLFPIIDKYMADLSYPKDKAAEIRDFL